MKPIDRIATLIIFILLIGIAILILVNQQLPIRVGWALNLPSKSIGPQAAITIKFSRPGEKTLWHYLVGYAL